MSNSQSDETKLAVIANDIAYIRGEVKDIKDQFASSFMAKAEGEILKARVSQLERIVYGMIGIILVGVLGSVMGLVLKK